MIKVASAIVSIAVLIVSAVSVFLFSGTKSILTGYSLKCENGAYMIIEESGSPIRYSFNNYVGTSVENFTDGDRILIISDVINESYPGSTSAYFIIKLSDGDIDNIPKATLRSLEELGWYKLKE